MVNIIPHLKINFNLKFKLQVIRQLVNLRVETGVGSHGAAAEGGEMPFLTFETRSRFCFLQSRASRRDQDFFTKSQGSRRDRDFCSLNLRLRDDFLSFDLEIRNEVEIFQ